MEINTILKSPVIELEPDCFNDELVSADTLIDGLVSDTLIKTDVALHTNQKDDDDKPNDSLNNIKGEEQDQNFDNYFDKIELPVPSLNPVIELEVVQEKSNLDLFVLDEEYNLIVEPGVYYIKKISNLETPGNNKSDLNWDYVFSENTFRTIDGQNNNLINPDWGAADTPLLRLTTPAYADGISEPRGGLNNSTLPSAREISNAVAAQGEEESIPNSSNLSDWFWQWGQFLDHDIDLTKSNDPLEPFDIEVPSGDPFFDPYETGEQTISLNRSLYDHNSTNPDDHKTKNIRQQMNEITAYIDGSMIYGSNKEGADILRAHDGMGKLLTTIGKNGETLLPYDPNNEPDEHFFIAGDERVNEQIGLTAIHTLFVREHNRIAEQIGNILDHGKKKVTMELFDESQITEGDKDQKKGTKKAIMELFDKSQMSKGDFIYESARRIVGAEIQTITYNEFLPLLIGKNAIADYTGYNTTVNPGISNEFSTAAFRVGHTMLSPQLLRAEPDGITEEIPLREAFFNPHEIIEDGVDSLLRGLGSQKAQEIDTLLISDVRNFLFGPPGAGGFDLASLNIQRGRDHGLADINTVRQQLGLSGYNDFDELTGGNEDLAKQFASVYDSIDDVDLWIGGLAEQHVPGAVVGETFQTIIADQFTRLRDGDRFWYEIDPYLNAFKGVIDKNTTLSEVIKDNSTVKDIQANAFIVSGNSYMHGWEGYQNFW